MDLTTMAAAGLRARMESLELLANNLANTSTHGYKADREFYTLYRAHDVGAGADGVGASPEIERSWTDFSQGLVGQTDNPLDIALSGRGYLAVEGPAGRLYTRNGSLRLSPAGVLTGAEGHPVLDNNGRRLRLDPTRPVVIDRDGNVTQEGQQVGRLALVEFANQQSLAKQGASYFTAGPDAGPKPAASLEVLQGKLESSNAVSADGAVRLVSVLRQFEMLEKALTLGGEMNRRAIEEVAKVGP